VRAIAKGIDMIRPLIRALASDINAGRQLSEDEIDHVTGGDGPELSCAKYSLDSQGRIVDCEQIDRT